MLLSPDNPYQKAASQEVQPEASLDVPGELGTLILRVGVSALMFHNGLDKLQDPEGFAKFVVEAHLPFLAQTGPVTPVIWTYLAAAAELVAPVGLALGVLARPSALALATTMGLAVAFHIDESGLEGFPLAVVEAHQYKFEAAALYALIFIWFVLSGPGRFSVSGGKK